MDAQRASVRRGCRLVGLSTATWQYQRPGSISDTAAAITASCWRACQAHAAVRPRYGYRRLHTLVAREGSDNGPEFAGRTLDAWAYRRGLELRFIRPGKLIENAYVERFNGKFRDECLNEHWFVSVAEAQQIIDAGPSGAYSVRVERGEGAHPPPTPAPGPSPSPAPTPAPTPALAPAQRPVLTLKPSLVINMTVTVY